MTNFTIHVAKTKALISFAITSKLICAFVFAYAKIQFSHDAAHLIYTHNDSYIICDAKAKVLISLRKQRFSYDAAPK